MDALISSMSKALVQKASDSCLFHALLPISQFMDETNLVKALGITDKIHGPVGLMVSLNTKNKASLINIVIQRTLSQLEVGGVVDHHMIRELHAARLSSFEETVEIFVFALEDALNDTH